MTKFRRSTTGCTACKRRRKKCDESKPRCQRCETSGTPCNYEYVEHQGTTTHLIQRTKPAPRPPSESLAQATRNTTIALEPAPASFPVPSAYGDPPRSVYYTTSYLPNIAPSSEESVNTLVDLTIPSLSDTDFQQINPWHTSPSFSLPGIEGLPDDGTRVVPGTEDLTQFDHDLTENIKNEDFEGIRPLLCIVPTLDRNAKDNALSFVLQCYSQWAVMFVFEPLKVVHSIREDVITCFSSQNTRARTILIANAMKIFSNNPSVSSTGMALITNLAAKVREEVQTFMATPLSPVLALDRQIAMRTLDNSLEVMTLQINACSMATCIQSVEDAAPVFRRACPEPLGQPINLANILLDPSVNLRHFVSLDIMGSVASGRLTHFWYEVTYSAELCDRMFQLQENYGLQWLHGLPDQFIMIFAWINSLYETQGAGVNIELINRIETEVDRVKIVTSSSGDPSLKIARTAVHECWRMAVLIYLYMVLCGADASDCRVVSTMKRFMRLVKGTKPGRIPDTYMANPMIVAGVAACKDRDRDIIRQRILSVPECATPGTAGHDAVLQLQDVWARANGEGRAAVWADLRIACFNITGM